MLNTLLEKWSVTLSDRKEEGLWREPFYLTKNELIDFSSNNYLGFAESIQIKENALKYAEEFGNGSTAARAVLEKEGLYRNFEKLVADDLGFENALYLNSGFFANVAVAEAVKSQKNEDEISVYADHRSHASTLSGFKMAGVDATLFRHGDLSHLESLVSKDECKVKIIFIESLHSMDADFYDAHELVHICKRNNSVLFIDEAHSIGWYGTNGWGWTFNHRDILKSVTLGVQLGFGKALGGAGGVVVGNQMLIDRIRQFSKAFLYSTSPSPLVVGTSYAAWQMLSSNDAEQSRQKLLKNIDIFNRNVQQLKVKNVGGDYRSPVRYVIVEGEPENSCHWSNALMEQGFLVRPIRPPTVPKGTSRLRIVLHSQHSEKEIESVLKCIHSMQKTI